MKKKILLVVLCALLAFSTFGMVACHKETIIPTVTLVDWQDETIEVGLHDDVTLSTDAVYDTSGNAYATTAVVKTTSGESVAVIGGKFTADYAGGYVITYSLFDMTVQASARTVTVHIKDSDTPVPYFERTALVVYENTAFAAPTYGVSLDPNYTAETTLTLYKITADGNEETRTEVADQPLNGNITLPAGNYVFTLKAVAGEKSGETELVFRVRYLDEKYAVSTLDSAAEINIGTSFWANSKNNWDARAVTFSASAARPNALSNGAAVATLPSEATESYFSVTPSISRADFIEAMGKEGARVSVWICVTSENGNRHTVRYGDHSNRKSITLNDGEWGNLLIAKEDFGTGDDLDALYDKLIGSAGNHTNTPFSVLHTDSGSYTVAVDSIYVAQPVSATLADKTVAQGATDTLAVACAETEEFVYTLNDLTSATDTPQISATGRFIFDVAGKVEATALPYRNRFYTPAPIRCDVTVNAAATFAFADNRLSVETPTKQALPAMASGSLAATGYKIETTDGNANYAYVDNGQIRVFKGDYKLYAFATADGIKYSTYIPVLCESDDDNKSNGDIATFNNPKDVDFTNVNESSLYSYVGDYKGASGVVKYGAGAWSQLRLSKSIYTAAQLEEQGFTNDDFLVIRVCPENIIGGYYIYFTHAYASKYVSDAGLDNGFACGDREHQTKNGHDADVAYLMAGVWQDVYISAKEFLTNYDRFIGWTEASGGAGFCFGDNGANLADIYVDSIRLVKGDSDTSNIESGNQVEFNAFNSATDFAAIAKANRMANGGAPVVYEASSDEHIGLLTLRTYTNEQWPSYTIPARANRTTYKNVMGTDDGAGWVYKMTVQARANHGGSTIGIVGASSSDRNIGDAWTTVEWDASTVLSNMTDDGVLKFVLAAAGNAVRYDVAIDKIWFEQTGIPVAVDDGVLTVPSAATITVNDSSVGIVSGNNKTFDLKTAILNDAWGSQDVSYTVSMTGLEQVTGVWSSPAAENEINGFGSTTAKNNFTANPHADCTASVIAEHNGRNGVAQIKCREQGDDAGWANFHIGAPMLTADQAAVYTTDSNAFIELEVCASVNLTIELRIGANIVASFPIKTTWRTVRIPAEYYNADYFADGTAYFNVTQNDNNLKGKTVYIDSIKFGKHASTVVQNDTRYDVMVIADETKYDFGIRDAEFEYVTNQTLGAIDNVDALKFTATDAWPTFGAILPRANQAAYTTWFDNDLASGKFIVQIYVQSANTNNLGIQGAGTNIEYSLRQGWNTVAIDATRVLQAWSGIGNTFKFVPCHTNGNAYEHTLYITAMYFAKDASVTAESDKIAFIDFSSATAIKKIDSGNAQYWWVSYVDSLNIDGTVINGAVRYDITWNWPAISGFMPMLSLDEYLSFFGAESVDEVQGNFVMKFYSAEPDTVMGCTLDNATSHDLTIQKGWNTVTLSAKDVLGRYNDLASAQLVPCRSANESDHHLLYFTAMYFEKTNA